MGDPEKDMNLSEVTIIVESETAFIAAGTADEAGKNLAGLVIPMWTGKKTIEDNLNY